MVNNYRDIDYKYENKVNMLPFKMVLLEYVWEISPLSATADI